MPDAPLEAALQLLLRFMALPDVAAAAAAAFRNLCVRCTGKLANTVTLAALVQAAEAPLSVPGIARISCDSNPQQLHKSF